MGKAQVTGKKGKGSSKKMGRSPSCLPPRQENLALLEEAARLFNARQFQPMRVLLEPALKADPDDVGLNSLMGQLALATDEYETALTCFDKVLLRFPDQLEFLIHRAMCLQKLDRKDEARAALERLHEQAPQNAVILKHLAVLSEQSKETKKAEEYLRKALEIDPFDAEILCLLGKILVDTQREKDALPYLKKAAKLRPTWVAPFGLLGAMYRQQCRFKTALSFYRYALRIAPDDVSSAVNYGVALQDTGRVQASIDQYRSHLVAHPASDQARFNLSMALLQIGKLEEGWEAYETRRTLHQMRDTDLPYPDWQGEPLQGKNILVLSEQGIGDEIWAASMFDDLIHQAGHCILECEPRLVTLFKRSFPEATVVPRHLQSVVYPSERPADVKLPAMSLARWLRRSLSQFPGKLAYLKPDPEREKFWHWRVAQLGAGLKVGISWRSMNIAGTRNNSYTTLTQWREILAVDGVQFINLQYGECQDELDRAMEDYGIRIHNFRDIDLKDGFDDVAALMTACDVVIAPDNTVGALAGALNIPTLQFVPSNYWSCHGLDYHPWYPSTKLFFRPWDQAWDTTLRSLAGELLRLARQTQAEARCARTVEGEEEAGLLRRRVQRGMLFFSSGQPTRAKSICEEILAVRPEHGEALLLLGATLREQGELGAAEAALVKAVEVDALLVEAKNLLGAVHLDLGQLDQAERLFFAALELRPGYPDALNNLGNVHAARGDYAAAHACYKKAVDTLSGFILGRYNLAMALDMMGKTDEALPEYLTVVESNPAHADAWNNLGILYGKLGRSEDAVEAYRKALAARPDNAMVCLNLAKQILRTGEDKSEAIGLLDKVVKQRPDDPGLSNTLGVAYAMQGEMEKARENFLRATTLDPGFADAFRNLGMACRGLGRLEEARDALQRALQLATNEGTRH